MSVNYSSVMNTRDIVDLQHGQKIMTNMLKEFDKLCRKHNIQYWCIAGTLLGVHRHRDWIPHDGDINLGILRSKGAYYKYTPWENNWDVNKGLQIDLFVYKKVNNKLKLYS